MITALIIALWLSNGFMTYYFYDDQMLEYETKPPPQKAVIMFGLIMATSPILAFAMVLLAGWALWDQITRR